MRLGRRKVAAAGVAGAQAMAEAVVGAEADKVEEEVAVAAARVVVQVATGNRSQLKKAEFVCDFLFLSKRALRFARTPIQGTFRYFHRAALICKLQKRSRTNSLQEQGVDV